MGQFVSRFAPPPGHQWGNFGNLIKVKPLEEIDIAGAMSPWWHGGQHQETLRATTSRDEYDGSIMHHALVRTRDKYGQDRHHVINIEADGRMLNSMEGGVASLHRHMDNLERPADQWKPTGSVFDPLPYGYKDKYGKGTD